VYIFLYIFYLEGRITELIIEGKERSHGCVLIYVVYKKTTIEEKIEKIFNQFIIWDEYLAICMV
jgi:hypothetical protein